MLVLGLCWSTAPLLVAARSSFAGRHRTRMFARRHSDEGDAFSGIQIVTLGVGSARELHRDVFERSTSVVDSAADVLVNSIRCLYCQRSWLPPHSVPGPAHHLPMSLCQSVCPNSQAPTPAAPPTTTVPKKTSTAVRAFCSLFLPFFSILNNAKQSTSTSL